MLPTEQTAAIANLVHEKSVEILIEVGFCVPDDGGFGRP